MKKKTAFLNILYAVSTFLLIACGTNDVYEGPKAETPEEDNGKLTTLKVPDNFDWSTTQKVKVALSSDWGSGENHTISLYTQGETRSALPVATGLISKNESYKAELTLPATVTKLTVVQSKRYCDGEIATMTTILPIIDHKVEYNLDPKSQLTTTRSTPSTKSTDFSLNKDWNSFDEFDGKNASQSGFYKVSAGKTATIPAKNNIQKGATIYVAGTLILPDDFDLKQEFTLVVLSPTQAGNDDGGLVMGKNMQIKNNFTLINYGLINMSGTITIGNGASVQTYGCIYADRLEVGENGKDDPDYIIQPGGCTNVNSMKVTKAEILLGKNAILHVAEALEVKDNSRFEGGDGYAIMQVGQIGLNENGGTTLIVEDIYVVADNQKDIPNGVDVKSDTGAQWGNTNGAKEANISIPPTHCSEGFNPEGNTSGTDPDQGTVTTTTGAYTFAFEDQWPKLGDYDMNDLVLYVEGIATQQGDKIEQLELRCSIRGIGASYRIAAAMQWDGISPNAITSVTYSEPGKAFTRQLFDVNANGTEKGQTYAVIPLFDDAHTFAAVSGISGARADQPNMDRQFTVTVTTDGSSVDSEANTIDRMNFFIACNTMAGKRPEVHLIDAEPTSLFNAGLATDEVASPDTPFRAKGNYCWAMRIPGTFHFPLESNDVRQSYENFDQWITDPSYDWYNHPISGKVK